MHTWPEASDFALTNHCNDAVPPSPPLPKVQVVPIPNSTYPVYNEQHTQTNRTTVVVPLLEKDTSPDIACVLQTGLTMYNLVSKQPVVFELECKHQPEESTLHRYGWHRLGSSYDLFGLYWSRGMGEVTVKDVPPSLGNQRAKTEVWAQDRKHRNLKLHYSLCTNSLTSRHNWFL